MHRFLPIPMIAAPIAVIAGLTAVARATELPYAMHPALHGDRLIFSAEGDLWTCTVPEPAQDGSEPVIVAYRLTSGDGVESHPVISPDGKQVAFAAQYEGNTDVYVMPVEGGQPQRLSWHPEADHPVAWRPDGRVLYLRSPRNHPHGRTELFEIAPRAQAGLPQAMRIGTVDEAAFSGTGNRVAFTRHGAGRFHWHGYRGGSTPAIWIGDLAGEQFNQLTEDRVTCDAPMWISGRIYYRSDRGGRFDIWSDRPQGGDQKRHTQTADFPQQPGQIDAFDVRFPSVDAAARGASIVFVQGGALRLLDTRADTLRTLNVRSASDRVSARPRFAPVHESLTALRFGHDAQTLLLESRGEIALLDRTSGIMRQLTRSSASREFGVSAIDEERVLLITDRTGEQQLWVMSLLTGGSMPVTEDREDWLFPPQVAPGGAHAAFADKTMRLHLVDLQTLERTQIDRAEGGEITDYRFSPDGQWLAWSHPDLNGMHRIRMMAVRTGRIFDVTDARSIDVMPRWDPAGRYLYFAGTRRPDPIFVWSDFTWTTAGSMQIFAVPLAQAVPPPLLSLATAAGFDLTAWSQMKESEETKGDAAADMHEDHDHMHAEAPQRTARMMLVDPDDLSARAIALPIPAGEFDHLEAVPGGVLFIRRPVTGMLSIDLFDEETMPGELYRWNALHPDDAASLAKDVATYALAPDMSAIVTARGAELHIVSLEDGEAETLSLESARLRVDPVQEWRHVLRESWRLQRDFFWAPNLLGIDWTLMRDHMETLLPRIATREELQDLVAQLARELRTSHAYAWGGDRHRRERPDAVAVGLLGAALEQVGGRVLVRGVLRGDETDAELTGPLSFRHLDVRDGDQVTSINDIPLRAGDNPWMLLEGTAGQPVRLGLLRDGAARTIEVTPIEDDSALRYLDWVDRNRISVEEASGGRIGYVHIPDMGPLGLSRFMRMYPPVHDRPALLIDVRSNGGGFVSQLIMQRIATALLALDAPRHGRSGRYPHMAPHAHMVFLIDEFAGSDGDIFPAIARKLELGPLIGRRTWGGVVGIRMDKPLIDAGATTQPEYAWWEPEGGWTIENEGVAPDIEIMNSPADDRRGRDAQLEAGIAHLLEQLERDARPTPTRPDYPVISP